MKAEEAAVYLSEKGSIIWMFLLHRENTTRLESPLMKGLVCPISVTFLSCDIICTRETSFPRMVF